MFTLALAKQQLRRLQKDGYYPSFLANSRRVVLPLPYLIAVASRETNCRNILGDLRPDGPHGVGLVQIDIQHDIARKARDNGTWHTPEVTRRLIDYGADLLLTNYQKTQTHFPRLQSDQWLKVAASAYNTGLSNAFRGSADHGDSDHHTTPGPYLLNGPHRGDYGLDVMKRSELFRQLIQPS